MALTWSTGTTTATSTAAAPANSTTTTCGSQPTDADYPNINGVLFFGDRGVAVDAAGSLWIAGGTQGTLVEVIGLAAPTLPLYIHNGVSTKP